MEKWKVAAIIGLLVALVGYGAIQSNQSQTPDPTTGPTPASTPEGPPPRIRQWEGKRLPAFSVPANYWANTDKPLTVDSFKGKVLLLEIWRADCPHCIEATPFMETLYATYHPRGLEMFTLHSPVAKDGVEGNWSQLQGRIKELGMKYPVAFDKNRRIFNLLKAERFPTTIVIGRNGIVTYSNQGYTPELKAKLLKAIEDTLAGTATLESPTMPPVPPKATPTSAKTQ